MRVKKFSCKKISTEKKAKMTLINHILAENMQSYAHNIGFLSKIIQKMQKYTKYNDIMRYRNKGIKL